MPDLELRKIRLAYKNMLNRCYNEKNASFENYGARGISVCDEWRNSRDAFIEWSLKSGHAIGLSLDRIDNEKGYSPENCRWATTTQQLRNQRRNKVISHDGLQMTASEWAERLGIGQDTLRRRVNVYGMPMEKALTPGLLRVPVQHGTRTAYESHGCRCDKCRESNNRRHRERRAKKKAQLVVDRLKKDAAMVRA